MSSSKFIICFTTIALLPFCFAFAAVDEDLSPLAVKGLHQQNFYCLMMSKSYDDALGTIKMMRRMQLDDMEKASRLLLMARETQLKLYEKTRFIVKMRRHVVV
ncbi:hypothetical protein Tco_0995623 [Tanacetum coccineum]